MDKNYQLPVAEDLPRLNKIKRKPFNRSCRAGNEYCIILEALKMSYDFIIVVVMTITITAICVVLFK